MYGDDLDSRRVRLDRGYHIGRLLDGFQAEKQDLRCVRAHKTRQLHRIRVMSKRAHNPDLADIRQKVSELLCKFRIRTDNYAA